MPPRPPQAEIGRNAEELCDTVRFVEADEPVVGHHTRGADELGSTLDVADELAWAYASETKSLAAALLASASACGPAASTATAS